MPQETKNSKKKVRQIIKKKLLAFGFHAPLMNSIEAIKNFFRYRKILRKNIRCVLEFKKRFNRHIFIETGTHKGNMTAAVKNHFQKLYTIELSDELYQDAQKRFAKDGHIELINGDSGIELPKILSRLDEPAQFWLDAHGSQGETVSGNLITPIEIELEAIFNHKIRNHIIMINDARDFTGQNGYPTSEVVERMAYRNGYSFEMKDDNIRLYPRQ